MRTWLVNIILPKNGYSFAVESKYSYGDTDVINACLGLGYFDDERDANIAVVEEITNHNYDLAYWEGNVLPLD